MERLIRAARRTQEIDESGDATFTRWLEELSEEVIQDDSAFDGWSFSSMLQTYLIWANGPNWDPWIWTAQPGDIPPK